jgi:hypothetical protein
VRGFHRSGERRDVAEAAAAGISRTAGQYWLAQSGGVHPRARRPRPALRLSIEEREAISRGLAQSRTSRDTVDTERPSCSAIAVSVFTR